MDTEHIESLKTTLKKLSHAEQDYLSSFLLMERLKRNKFVMPDLHKRVDDANTENWNQWGENHD